MKKTIRSLAIIFVVASVSLIGCKKKETTEENTEDYDTQAASDNALAEGSFNDFSTMADDAAQDTSVTTFRLGDGNQHALLSACAHVTYVPGTFTINFNNGSGGACQSTQDYRWRKGTVTVSFTGLYRDSGTVITITPTNYYVGSDTIYWTKVSGTRTITNKGRNTSGNLWYTIVVNATLTNYKGQSMTWNSTRTREWTGGESTLLDWTDDEYKITGSASGTSYLGINYSVNITQALNIALNCRWIKGGSFDFTPDGKAVRTLNFGDGSTCDYNATITILGRTYPIVLP